MMRYRAASKVPGGNRLPSEEELVEDPLENPEGVRWAEGGGADGGMTEAARVWVSSGS
jgi:hypothetical protein